MPGKKNTEGGRVDDRRDGEFDGVKNTTCPRGEGSMSIE